MKAGMKITGLSAVRAELRYLEGAVPDAARKQMHRSAVNIRDLAREYAPEDQGWLVRGIQIIKDYAGMNGRLQIDVGIVMPADATTKDGKPLSSQQFDTYATLVHENYESILREVREDGTPGGPSRATLEKMAANPGKVGSGFLRTAAREEEERLPNRMFEAITYEINKVSGK